MIIGHSYCFTLSVSQWSEHLHMCVLSLCAVNGHKTQHSSQLTAHTKQSSIARYMENSDIVFTYVQIVYIIGHKSIT